MKITKLRRIILRKTYNDVDPSDRDVWRSNVRSTTHAASQLPGGEPTDHVDDAPASAR